MEPRRGGLRDAIWTASILVAQPGEAVPDDQKLTGFFSCAILCVAMCHSRPSNAFGILAMSRTQQMRVCLSMSGGNCSQQAKDLITGMLDKDPAKRMTAQQILDHPWCDVTHRFLTSPYKDRPSFRFHWFVFELLQSS